MFKRNFINVDCFTTSQTIEQSFPIQRASRYVPDWWRSLDTYLLTNNKVTGKPSMSPTMKTCYGFVELYKHGLVMPLWSEVDLFVEPNNYFFHGADHKFRIGSHPVEEWGNNFPDHFHMKLISPWAIKENTGVKFIVAPCVWSHFADVPDLRILPGIVNYKYQHSTNINWFVPKINKHIKLNVGLPLVQMVPLTDKKVKVKTHVIDEKEWTKMELYPHNRFIGSFIRFMRTRNKCPIGER